MFLAWERFKNSLGVISSKPFINLWLFPASKMVFRILGGGGGGLWQYVVTLPAVLVYLYTFSHMTGIMHVWKKNHWMFKTPDRPALGARTHVIISTHQWYDLFQTTGVDWQEFLFREGGIHVWIQDEFVRGGGGGGAEVSCPDIFYIAKNQEWFCPEIAVLNSWKNLSPISQRISFILVDSESGFSTPDWWTGIALVLPRNGYFEIFGGGGGCPMACSPMEGGVLTDKTI